MAIEWDKETRERALESIRAFFTEHTEEEIGDLKAAMLLDFFLEELGPTVYNHAITDASAYLRDKLTDLGADVYHTEFTYWKR